MQEAVIFDLVYLAKVKFTIVIVHPLHECKSLGLKRCNELSYKRVLSAFPYKQTLEKGILSKNKTENNLQYWTSSSIYTLSLQKK